MKKIEIIFFIIGLLMFSFVILDIFWWIEISSNYSKSLIQVNKEFLAKFPSFIKNGKSVSILNITFLLVAGFLFLRSKSIKGLKILSFILLSFCVLIGIWQLFTLLQFLIFYEILFIIINISGCIRTMVFRQSLQQSLQAKFYRYYKKD